MTPLILFGLLAGVPFLLLMILRVHTNAFFISIAGGYLLSQFVGDTAGLISSSIIKNGPNSTLIAVFLIPMIITAWFMRKSLPTSQFFVQLLPQLANSLLIFILLVPMLSSNMQANLNSDPLVQQLINANDAVVAVAVVAQLGLMIITARPSKG